MRFSNIIVLSFLICSCTSTAGSPSAKNSHNEIIHPTEENIPPENTNLQMINDVVPFDKDLFLDHPSIEIGSMEPANQDRNSIIAEVGGLHKLDKSIIYLDNQLVQLRFYDMTGNITSNFEISGRGPGEVVQPITFSISKNRILILDAHNKVNIYDIVSDSITYTDSIILDFAPEDMCILNDMIYIRGVKVDDTSSSENVSSSIVHLYSLDDLEYVRSIGEGYKSDNWLTVNQLSDGPIACLDDENLILYSFEYLPFVYVMDTTGTVEGLIDIREEFDQGRIVEKVEGGRPSITFRPNDQELFEQVQSLSYDQADKLLYIQSSLQDYSRGVLVPKTKTFIVDLINSIRYEPVDDFPFVRYVDSNHIISSKSEPFPGFSLHKK